MSTKRDQINVILDADMRAALDEILAETHPTPTVRALVRDMLMERRADVRRAAKKRAKEDA